MKMRRKLAMIGVLAMSSAASFAPGATITAINSVIGPGSAVEVPGLSIDEGAQFLVPNNDNVDFSDNFFFYDVTFTQSLPIDVVFAAVDSGGTSEYDTGIFTLGNNTAQTWTGFRMELGFGTGSAFQPIAGTNLDFDTPDMDSFVDNPAAFPIIDHQETSLTFTGGNLAPTISGGPSFSIDVPDSTLVPASAKTADGYLFTLRHTPLTPAPPNQPPIADDVMLTVFTDNLVDLTITGNDPEGGALMWELLSFTGPMPLQAPTFDPLTQQFRWDTTGSQPGIYVVEVRATDDGMLSDIATLTIQLDNVGLLTVVPEPLSACALLLAGSVGLVRRRRQRT